MKNVAAYLLLVLGGNATPSSDDIKKVITAAGGEPDGEKIDALINELKDKNLDEIIEAGKKKVSNVSTGGGGAAPSPAGKAAAGGAAPAAAAEEPKKSSSSSAGGADLGGGLFGGDALAVFCK